MKKILLLVCSNLIFFQLIGQEVEVRPYPYPGATKMGVFVGESDDYFDYSIRRVFLRYDDKKEFWEEVKQRHGQNSSRYAHDIYMIHCMERKGTLEEAIKLIDNWFQPEEGIETYPELLPAISIGEENVPERNNVLNGIAIHIRSNYGIAVFQWYSSPLEPSRDLIADGWIWDSYGWSEFAFRKHAMKFLSLGKPVICVPWGTDPQWPEWTKYPSAEKLVDREWIQFRICTEFNISTALFAVAGKGSVRAWLRNRRDEMQLLRNMVRVQRTKLHAMKNVELPLPTADYSPRSRNIPIVGDESSPGVFHEHFTNFAWINNANLEGFTNLKLNSTPNPIGILNVRSKGGQIVESSLIYRFETIFPIKHVKVSMSGTASKMDNAVNTISISTDEIKGDWSHKATQSGIDSLTTFTLDADEEFFGEKKVFFVKVNMSNQSERDYDNANQISGLTVEVTNKIQSDNLRITEFENTYGTYSYEDDFSSSRWKYFGKLHAQHSSHGGYRGDEFWVGLIGGSITWVDLTQRMTIPKDANKLIVQVETYADLGNLGGSVSLKLAPAGGSPKWETNTKLITKEIHKGWLTLEIPGDEIVGLRDFDIFIKMSSSTGVERGPRACANVDGIKIVVE